MKRPHFDWPREIAFRRHREELGGSRCAVRVKQGRFSAAHLIDETLVLGCEHLLTAFPPRQFRFVRRRGVPGKVELVGELMEHYVATAIRVSTPGDDLVPGEDDRPAIDRLSQRTDLLLYERALLRLETT
jgi:hypothetical protein